MKKFLAIGSSQLAGFTRAMRQTGLNYEDNFDYAGIWETGFGYLDLSKDGKIIAPNFIPPINNKPNYNLEKIWLTYKTKKIPCIHDYDSIFIVSSPSKYFAPFYYPNPSPIRLSGDLLKHCIDSWFMDTSNFDKYNLWQFRISNIIAKLCSAVPEKIIFVGSPLATFGKEVNYTEKLRVNIAKNEQLHKIHLHNYDLIKKYCNTTSEGGKNNSVKFLLPPDHLLCDYKITKLKEYEGVDFWHANVAYWVEIIKQIIRLKLL